MGVGWSLGSSLEPDCKQQGWGICWLWLDVLGFTAVRARAQSHWAREKEAGEHQKMPVQCLQGQTEEALFELLAV